MQNLTFANSLLHALSYVQQTHIISCCSWKNPAKVGFPSIVMWWQVLGVYLVHTWAVGCKCYYHHIKVTIFSTLMMHNGLSQNQIAKHLVCPRTNGASTF
jgi:hypothetical protein